MERWFGIDVVIKLISRFDDLSNRRIFHVRRHVCGEDEIGIGYSNGSGVQY
jgi:hypothetical protein